MLAVVLLMATDVAEAQTRSPAKRAKTIKKAAVYEPATLRRARADRSALLRRRAKTASKVDALRSNSRRVEQALRTLNGNVNAQSAAVDNARRAAQRATVDASEARARELATRNNLLAMRGSHTRAAVSAYTRSYDDALVGFGVDEPLAMAANRQIMIDVATRKEADLIDQLRALDEDLALERAAADASEQRARSKRRAYENRLKDLTSARNQQRRVAAASEDRLERALGEAAALSAVDKRLARRIEAEQASLIRQLRLANRGGRGGQGAGGAIGSIREIPTGSTNGIVVAASIRGRVAGMVNAAAADGIALRGSGYRSPSMQVVLRRAHCGSSTFAIYQMRASSCRPPTARPGQSMHEQGLAIDFVDGGGTLTRGSRAYRWLKANAHKYGFFNLPSEPWHWSVNGR